MSKLLNSTLEKVSENNNEYRKSLRKLNSQIDERTTALVGDIVTLSNYTTDFSNAITVSKEKLVNPILRAIESYVIRDLRSVENVNEQFIEKINDKIENTAISTKEEQEKFISNLDVLLNEKYLEIVSIKRVKFIENNENKDVENSILDFINYIKTAGNYDESRLADLVNTYKIDIYYMISKTLSDISSLYLNNFVNGVSSDIKSLIDFDSPYESEMDVDAFKPYIPEINPVTPIDIPMIPEVPVISEEPNIESTSVNYDIPLTPNFAFDFSEEPVKEEAVQISEPNSVDNVSKKTYDVEEILKIAKSPVVTMPDSFVKEDENKEEPALSKLKEQDSMDFEFNERELVEEMIRRFQKRLQDIDTRQEDYDQESKLVSDDEVFVKDLISSAESKKVELDEFEDELDNKAKELDEKEKELQEKINNVLPFANAVLENDKES